MSSIDAGDLFMDSLRHLALNAVLFFSGFDPERQRIAEQIFVLASSAVVPRTEEEVEGKQENEQSNVHPLIEQFRNLNPVISTQMEGRLLQIYEACLEYSTLEEVAEEINVGIGKKGMSVSELVLNMELFLNGL